MFVWAKARIRSFKEAKLPWTTYAISVSVNNDKQQKQTNVQASNNRQHNQGGKRDKNFHKLYTRNEYTYTQQGGSREDVKKYEKGIRKGGTKTGSITVGRISRHLVW